MKHVKLFEQFLTESVDMDDLKNAKEKLSNPHTILDITYSITRRGDRFVRFDYENKYVPGKMVDSGPHFVKVFYGNDKDLKKISKELGMDLKESVVNEHYFEGEMARDLKDKGVRFKKGDKVTLEIQPNNYVIYGPNKKQIVLDKRDFEGAIDQYVIYESLVNEAKADKKHFDKVVKILSKSKYPFTVMLVTKWNEIDIVIGHDAPDSISDDIDQKLTKAKLNWGGGSGITISGDSSNYSRREYDEIARINGGHKDY